MTGATRTVSLRNIFLHVTRGCNQRCGYCYLEAGEALAGAELSAAELDRLWPEMVALGPRKVVFTGGEPLLRPDLLRLLAGLKRADPEHAVLRCLNTNGRLVTPELAQAFVGLADEIRVSVDGLRERNNRQRGEGSFEAAIRALQILHSAGFEPIALATVTREGLGDLEDLLAFLVQRGITRIHLNPLRAIGRGASHADWHVAPEEARAVLRGAWVRIFPGVEREMEPAACKGANCGVGSFLNILPEGDVYPCHVLVDSRFRLGNVREQSLTMLCAANGPLAEMQRPDFQRPGTCATFYY